MEQSPLLIAGYCVATLFLDRLILTKYAIKVDQGCGYNPLIKGGARNRGLVPYPNRRLQTKYLITSFPALRIFVFSTNQNAKHGTSAFWMVKLKKSWRARKLGGVLQKGINPVSTSHCHMIYYHGDKKYPCLKSGNNVRYFLYEISFLLKLIFGFIRW